jgi:1,4-alpha-glucan branching enzyme
VVGCSAAVWAPHARSVVIAGDHDGWAGWTSRARSSGQRPSRGRSF